MSKAKILQAKNSESNKEASDNEAMVCEERQISDK